ncbi:hypothetical protein L226DRAFT_464333 [Lentinus tigrinus ALCF2SS1-7]|uniref:DUF6533 domain-containing protein n=1 Tax=Lentinus tigrinus ALCF2SS1-6 TaxID=1328759 RepID=A0A5C2RW76_9APHY|nr:hypothetical protein L227DRAFT_510920 [Lentinus tigrinus ALCF2SS1-6]RPD74151.1 hypothetical protein L226DRAFT_464333 [Lentinus tigrinus ALCF2SS1-7]
MPSIVILSAAELQPVLESADAAFLISCAATALVLYEHVITFGTEVQQVWKRNISGATILFILTRYMTLLNRIFVTIGLYSIDSKETASASILIVVMSAIAAVRVYALWNRDIRLFIVVMVAGMFPALTNLFFRSASSVYILPTNLYSCQVAPTAMAKSAYIALSIATRVVSICSDGLVVALTWVKTYRVFVLTRKISFRTNYSALILRDGTLYFLAVCVLNLVAIVYLMNVGTNLLNDMIVTLSSLLMARFLLNLRDHRSRSEDISYVISDPAGTMSARSVSTIHFQTDLLDSMAGSVGALDEDDEDDDMTACEHAGTMDKHLWDAHHSDSKELDGVLVLDEKGASWV